MYGWATTARGCTPRQCAEAASWWPTRANVPLRGVTSGSADVQLVPKRQIAHGLRVRLRTCCAHFHAPAPAMLLLIMMELGLPRATQAMSCEPCRCMLFYIDLSASASVGDHLIHDRPQDPPHLMHTSGRMTTDGNHPSSAMRATAIRLAPTVPRSPPGPAAACRAGGLAQWVTTSGLGSRSWPTLSR